MPIPDIKDAGILAGVGLWGWPYHGLCSGGSIALPGGGSRTMVQPAHGAAWLYDLGLPPIVRTPDELAADAALGHQWLNYAFISGGVVYGVQLSNRQFIHVDEAGVRWLLTVNFSVPEISLQRVRLLITIERFGVLRQNGAGTSILIQQIDVQCTHIAKSGFASATYVATDVRIEDVWTNGSRVLLGVYRTSSVDEGPGGLADMYSLIEATISGTGGSDGGDLEIDAVEIRSDAQLTFAAQASNLYSPWVPGSLPETIGVCGILGNGTLRTPSQFTGVAWADWKIVLPGVSGGSNHDREDLVSFAQGAHYDASGVAHVYRLQTGYRQKWTYVSSSNSVSGFYCSDPDAPGTGIENTAMDSQTTSVALDIEYGLTLLRDDTEIDSVKFTQHADCMQMMVSKRYGDFGWTGPDPLPEPPAPSGWLSDSFGCQAGGGCCKQASLFTAPVMSGSLAGALAIPPPPFTGQQSFSWLSPPLDEAAVQAIYLAWRANMRYAAAGSAVIGGSDHVGVHRIDSKSVAFYLQTGGVRTYATVHTPLGPKSAGLPPSDDLYFAWHRKTGDFAFRASAACWV